MSIHPARLVVMQHLVRVSATIEVQLLNKASPLVVALQMARDEAAEAAIKLLSVSPEDVSEIRKLQNQVARFVDLVRWLQAINSKGFEADREMQRDETEEYADLLDFRSDGNGGLDFDEANEAGLTEEVRHDA